MWIAEIICIASTVTLRFNDKPANYTIAMKNWQFSHGTSAVPATHIITYVIVIIDNGAYILRERLPVCNTYCHKYWQ
jgi:hypothetical protein